MADELDGLHTRRGILQAAGPLGMGLGQPRPHTRTVTSRRK
jgi:hypothetical protein